MISSSLTAPLAIACYSRIRTSGASVYVSFKAAIRKLCANRPVFSGADLGPGLRAGGQSSDTCAAFRLLRGAQRS